MRHRVRMIVWLALLLAACGPITAPAEPSPSTIPSSIAGVTPTQAELHTRLPTASAPPSAVPQPTPTLEPTATPAPAAHTLIVTNSAGHTISFIDPQSGTVTLIEVGAAPWGLALAPNQIAYVATAEGVAVVDIRQRERVALIAYQAAIGQPTLRRIPTRRDGHRVAPDGERVYVGVFLPDRSGRLEVIDTDKRTVIASVPIGVRPFQVLASRDGRTVYTVDHDTFTVTAIDAATYATRTLPVEPLGNGGWGSWDKPHYAALRADGHLLLPIQGRVLVDLDPVSGKSCGAAAPNEHPPARRRAYARWPAPADCRHRPSRRCARAAAPDRAGSGDHGRREYSAKPPARAGRAQPGWPAGLCHRWAQLWQRRMGWSIGGRSPAAQCDRAGGA